MNTSFQPDDGEENAENSLAAQTEMLNTVTQLLQQNAQVNETHHGNTKNGDVFVGYLNT